MEPDSATHSGGSSDGGGNLHTTCLSGQYEDAAGGGGCQPCALSGWAVWALLLLGGAMMCGVVCWVGDIVLRKFVSPTDAKGTVAPGGGAGLGQLAAHGARSAVNIRHAMTTISSTATSFQFLFLYQLHLTWPAMVTQAWQWLSSLIGLTWLRLEFLFTAIKSLCALQYVPPAAVLVAPFAIFSVILAISQFKAKRKESNAQNVSAAPRRLLHV